MLYLRWSVGVRGLGATTFGLRYDRASPVYAESATLFAASMRHRSLIDLEFCTRQRAAHVFRAARDLGHGPRRARTHAPGRGHLADGHHGADGRDATAPLAATGAAAQGGVAVKRWSMGVS